MWRFSRKAIGALDDFLQDTQFGFRPARSTTQPINCVRRALAYLERAGAKVNVIGLDWTRTLDRIRHEVTEEALRRHMTPEPLAQAALSLYTNPEISLELHSIRSKWLHQERGVRQS